MRFVPVAGPPATVILFETERPVVLGRSSQAEVQLSDQVVSRRHAQVQRRAGEWVLTDLDSRHGTFVNGVRLSPSEPTPIQNDDRVRIGPWTFRVRIGAAHDGSSLSIADDRASSLALVQRVGDRELAIRAEARLDLLVEAAARIAGATDEHQMASAALEALVSATGFPRGAVLRLSGGGEGVEVIAHRGATPGTQAVGESGVGLGVTIGSRAGEQPDLLSGPGSGSIGGAETGPAISGDMFSRSLLEAASAGNVVRIGESAGPQLGQSIMSLGIEQAICAPIMVDGQADAFIYLDARGRDAQARVQGDAPAFCSAVAKICSLSLGNLQRHKLQARQKQLEADLKAARRAQLLISPPASGVHGSAAWATLSRPGRFVAGDLMDVVPLPDGRLAVLLGDVSGKGMGTALLMVTAQTRLSGLLRSGAELGPAVTEVNRFIAEFSTRSQKELEEAAMFVSLACAVINPGRTEAALVDAGHGFCVVVEAGKGPSRIVCEGGLPLGVDGSCVFTPETIALTPGSRLVLFSDGVVEQPGQGEGAEQFGFERTLAALAGSVDAAGDVGVLLDHLRLHAGGEVFADDVSVLSVRV